MNVFRPFVLLALVAVATACERRKAPPPAESTVTRPAGAPESTAAPHVETWDPSAGRLLLVEAASPAQAFVVVPDSSSATQELAAIPHPASVTLFGRSGTVQEAELPSVADTGACIVAGLNAAPPPRPWNVGFIGGVVAPLAVDSVGSLSAADSATYVAWLNRLASALPNDTAGRFSGLPFSVQSIWRFNLATGPQVLVGTLTRQINQEATPLQERTLIVAERAVNDSTFSTAYSERGYGNEETIESGDLIAAVVIGSNRRPAIILSRDFGNATAYALLERSDDGHWQLRWTSARRPCS